MGKNKKKNNPKKPKAEVAANSTPPSQDSPENRNDPPARDDGNKSKEAKGAPSNSRHPSKRKGMEFSDDLLYEPIYFPDRSGNMVRVGYTISCRPPSAGVESASPRRSDGTKNSPPAAVQPGASGVRKSPDSKTKGVSTSGPADDNLEKEMEKLSISPEKGKKSNRACCRICNAERVTKRMLRSSKCGHYFCKVCIRIYVNDKVLDEAKQGILAIVHCPCKENLPENIVSDHLNQDVKSVWIAVHAFWNEGAPVAEHHDSPVLKSPDLKTEGVSTSVAGQGESSALKIHDLKQQEAEEGAKSIGIKCEMCSVEKSTKPLRQAFRCEHYFCLGCYSDRANVGCPVEECPKNRLTKDIRDKLFRYRSSFESNR